MVRVHLPAAGAVQVLQLVGVAAPLHELHEAALERLVRVRVRVRVG